LWKQIYADLGLEVLAKSSAKSAYDKYLLEFATEGARVRFLRQLPQICSTSTNCSAGFFFKFPPPDEKEDAVSRKAEESSDDEVDVRYRFSVGDWAHCLYDGKEYSVKVCCVAIRKPAAVAVSDYVF
jgi:hypothetical protein